MNNTTPLHRALIWIVLVATVLFPMGMPLHAAPASLLSSTTLNGAINATQTTLVLTSASASTGSSFGAPAAGQCLVIDRESMQITAVSSTTMTVRRAPAGASPHATLAIVLTGPCSQFHSADPPSLGGNQDCTQVGLPWVNVPTGDSWWCGQAGADLGLWSVTNTITRNGTAGSRRVAQ